MTTPLISVIVPIYNVEKYLNRCIDSILKQTYTNLEIILIDDGSPDNCPKICDQYKMKDTRIIVIHQVNSGLSGARNAGILKASGKYITFIDSDDYIHPILIEQLYTTLIQSNKQISACSYTYYEDQFATTINEKYKCYNSSDSIKEILLEREFQPSAWGKLYDINLFDSIQYPVGKIFEDYYTAPYLFHLANGVAYVNSKLYYYNYNIDSITKSKFNKKQMQYFEISNSVKKFLKKKYPSMLELAKQRDVSVAISYYKKMCKDHYTNDEDRKMVLNTIKDNYKLFMKSNYPIKKRLASLFISAFSNICEYIFK